MKCNALCLNRNCDCKLHIVIRSSNCSDKNICKSCDSCISNNDVCNSSVIRQKVYVCVSGGKKCLFFQKFCGLCFLEIPVLRFTLLPYYRQTAAMTEVMVLVRVAVEKQVEILVVISYINCKRQ